MRGMLNTFKKMSPTAWFAKRKHQQMVARYRRVHTKAPYTQALPTVPVDVILEDHESELIFKAYRASGVSEEKFASTYRVMIQNYANLVHLLPASRDYHHVSPGGLLAHGLEVAINALKMTAHVRFEAMSVVPTRALKAEPMWRMATFAAGLCHDIGKVAVSMKVTDHEKRFLWCPWQESLLEWAHRNRIVDYHVEWVRLPNEEHEMVASAMLDMVIPKDLKGTIAKVTGGAAITEIVGAITNKASPLNRIAPLVQKADSMSTAVSHDRLKVEASVFEAAPPYYKHITDVIRQKLRPGKGGWPVNVRGARAYNTELGPMLTWLQCARDIGAQIDAEPAALTDPDTMADLLLEEGIAEPFVNEHGMQQRYWIIEVSPPVDRKSQVNHPPVQVKALKIRNTAMLWDDEPPPVINAALIGGKGGEPDQDKAKEVAQTAAASVSDTQSTPDSVEAPSDKTATEDGKPANSAKKPKKSRQSEKAPSKREPKQASQPTETKAPGETAPVEKELATQQQSSSPEQSESDRATQANATTPEQDETQANKEALRQEAIKQYERIEDAEILVSLASMISLGKKSWGKDALRDEDGAVLIVHPKAWSKLGTVSREMLAILKGADLIESTARNPQAVIHERTIEGKKVRAIKLKPEPSKWFIDIAQAPVPNQNANNHPVADKPTQATASSQKREPEQQNETPQSGDMKPRDGKDGVVDAQAESAPPAPATAPDLQEQMRNSMEHSLDLALEAILSTLDPAIVQLRKPDGRIVINESALFAALKKKTGVERSYRLKAAIVRSSQLHMDRGELYLNQEETDA